MVLVAEDNEHDIFILKRAWTRANLRARIQVVADGEEALAYLKGAGRYSDRARFIFPRLVLLDVKMPRKNGFEVLKEVRGDARLKRLPVVMFTNSEEPRDINQAFDLHANSYLVKPADTHLLEQMLQSLEEYWLTFNKHPSLTRS